MSNRDETKFRIGIVDGLILGVAIFFFILFIAGIIYGAVGQNGGIFEEGTGLWLIIAGAVGATLFIIIFLIYEIIAVVKIKKAKTYLMLGAAPEQKRTPKALGAGNRAPVPSPVQCVVPAPSPKIEVNQKWATAISAEEMKKAEEETFVLASSKEVKEMSSSPSGKEITIMISLDKEEVESVIKGGKSVLFFKTLPIQDVKKVIVFLKKTKGWPGGVIGQFNLSEKRRMPKDQAWAQYGNDSTLTKESFDKYYKGMDSVYLIKIGNLVQYQQPKALASYGAKKPPIVFFYLR